MAQPNILLITDDQHRWDFFGDMLPVLRTPNLDRLRREGTTLTHAFSNCPICMPTRFTWLYGLYASQGAAKLIANDADWPTHLRSMAHALQDAGYHTALIGKLHSMAGLYPRDVCQHEDETRARGFDHVWEVSGKSLASWYDCRFTRHLESIGELDRYRERQKRINGQLGGKAVYEPGDLSEEDNMDGLIGRRAADWLRSYAGRKPFFLHASFCAPHPPLDPPPDYFERYRPEDMPVPAGVEDRQKIRRFQEFRAAYCAQIELVDHQVGRLLEALEARGWLQNTVIFFGTDHGDMLGDLGMGSKGHPQDGSCRTPYTVWWPGPRGGAGEGGGVPAGRTLLDPVEAVDLPCTILEAAGVLRTAPGPGGAQPGELEGADRRSGERQSPTSPGHVRSSGLEGADRRSDPSAELPATPGRSFWRYVLGQAEAHRPWAYAEHAGWRMVRERDWKYVYYPKKGDMLYDMANDPHEMRNLIDDPAQAERIGRMRRQLIESMTRIASPHRPRAAKPD